MYQERAIISGQTVEYSTYSIPIKFRDFLYEKIEIKTQRKLSDYVYDKKRIQNLSQTRTKSNIIRLINTNHKEFKKFLTLTFNSDITNFDLANYEFNKFIKRLKKVFPTLKYICVPEFTKKGRIHYHVICNLPYLENKHISNIWKNGFIRINKIKSTKYLAYYLTKYLTKEHFDERFNNKKKYFCTRSLLKPIIIYGYKAYQFYQQKLESIVPFFAKIYRNLINNEINYKIYYLQT